MAGSLRFSCFSNKETEDFRGGKDLPQSKGQSLDLPDTMLPSLLATGAVQEGRTQALLGTQHGTWHTGPLKCQLTLSLLN